jgi:plastocyanin
MKRRLALGLALAASAFAAAPSGAAAQKTIDAVFLGEYSDPTYTVDQGEIVVFRNRDPFLAHGVLSDESAGGEPRFEAPVAPPRHSRLVRGAPFLTTDTYQFHCPIHPGMVATLEVTANGEPLPPDSTAPTTALRVDTRRLGALLNRRRLRLTVDPSEAQDVAIDVRAAGLAVASPGLTYVTPGPRTLLVRIRRPAAKRLRERVAKLRERGRRSLRLVASATLADVAGNAGSAAAARRLRLPPPRPRPEDETPG